MSSLSSDQLALFGCIAEGDIPMMEGYFEAYPGASIEYEDGDVISLDLTPIITSVYHKQHAATQWLIAKGANPCHITAVGTNALSTALEVNDPQAIAFFHPLFKAQVWGGGEDRLLVEEVQAVLDNYYPAMSAKEDDLIRDYRAEWVPKLQRYRTQAAPLSQTDKEELRKEKKEFDALLEEREHHKLKRQMLANQILDPKEREAFIKADTEARDRELEKQNQARKEKNALAQKAAELEHKAKALETELQAARREQQAHSQQVRLKHTQLIKIVGVLEQKVGVLWDAHEKAAEVKAEQEQIRAEEPLRVFYQGVRATINRFFVGRQVAASGEVEVTDPSKNTQTVFSILGDAIPLPGAKLVTTVIGGVVVLYQKYQKYQRDQSVDAGLAALASDSSELNDAIIEPATRRLTLMGAAQLRRFDKTQVELLAASATRLLLIFIIYELPEHPEISYADLIQQLLLTVRVRGLTAVKIKDANGNSFKPRQLTTLDQQRVCESQVFAAFDTQVPRPKLALTATSTSLVTTEVSLRQAPSASQTKKQTNETAVLTLTSTANNSPAVPARAPALPSVPAAKSQPVKAAELRPRSVSPTPPARAVSPAPQRGLLSKVFGNKAAAPSLSLLKVE